MYKIAHRWFAAGFCASLALAFNFTLGTIILLILIAGILGPLPDIDQKIGFLDHRGATHTILFTLLITFPLAIFIVYVSGAVNNFINYSLLTTSVVDLEGVSVPGTFYHLRYGDLVAGFTDPFFLIFLCLFLAMFSHLLLDIITPSGIHFWNKNLVLKGGLLSSDKATNKMFSSLGFLLIVLSVIFKIGMMFDPQFAKRSWLVAVTFFALIIVFIVAFYTKGKRESHRFKCYQMDGERFCSNDKCSHVKGKKLCATEDHLIK